MTETIIFPDAETLTINLLKPRLTPTPVSTIIPATHTPQDTHIRVTRAGGARHNLTTDSALIITEIYAPTTLEAANLAARARGIMQAAAGLDARVRKVKEAGGLVFLPDPESNQPKYQFVTQLFIAGVPEPI